MCRKEQAILFSLVFTLVKIGRAEFKAWGIINLIPATVGNDNIRNTQNVHHKFFRL